MTHLASLVKDFLNSYGLKGDSFAETPRRVEQFWDDFLDTSKEPRLTVFDSPNKEMITLKDYICWGFCPHHLLPVRYTFRIAYFPDGKVLGLSKLILTINHILKGLPLQEDLPTLIVDYIDSRLSPKGVACKVEGMHLCMVMRGVKSEVTVITTTLRGYFVDYPSCKEEFLK